LHICQAAGKKNVILHGDARSCALRLVLPPQKKTRATEYLVLPYVGKIVSIERGHCDINRYSRCTASASSRATILPPGNFWTNRLRRSLDNAAPALHGGEFGFGAEIAFHAKAAFTWSIGLPELNSNKYKIHGKGQVR
jgi:gamma-glutamyl phosphate reductase